MDLDFRRNFRRKHGSKSFWIWEGKVFLDTIPKAQVVKKQNKTQQQLKTVNFTKIKNLCPTNYTIKKVKDNPQNEREIDKQTSLWIMLESGWGECYYLELWKTFFIGGTCQNNILGPFSQN